MNLPQHNTYSFLRCIIPISGRHQRHLSLFFTLAALCRLLGQFTSLWIELSCPLRQLSLGSLLGFIFIFRQKAKRFLPQRCLDFERQLWRHSYMGGYTLGKVHGYILGKKCHKEHWKFLSFISGILCDCSATTLHFICQRRTRCIVTSAGKQSCWNRPQDKCATHLD